MPTCPKCQRDFGDRAYCPCQGPVARGINPVHRDRMEWALGRLLAGPASPGLPLADGTTTGAGEQFILRICPDEVLGFPHFRRDPEVLTRMIPANHAEAQMADVLDVAVRAVERATGRAVERVTEVDLFLAPEHEPQEIVVE